ncbi:hypothetical protein JXA40_03020 [bacterium]|nr:hypothetical protein [candidate division CSSED10-310 bacterium]
MMERIPVHKGMLCHLIRYSRPDLVGTIERTGQIQSIVVGLGRQGMKHAGLMRDFGTTVTAGIAPDRGGQRIHEIIPVYDSVSECLRENPDIACASIWRHYTTARDAALEIIEAGIPIVVLITEFIPRRDVRDILHAARKRNIVLIGGNTPGIIFPPEGIKIGMLPDVFYPEEPAPRKAGPSGVTVISRSGAILYHMSEGLASAGIAQNAVLGVGGDGVIGSTFRQLVPMAMEYEHTDLVVIAGEIGGSQEELLAQDIQANPAQYPKPMIALISGAHAPEGKTMGHAGAIVSPGQEYGTFQSKKKALEEAGVPVVNSQYDLIRVAKEKLVNKTYFQVSSYYEAMRRKWETPPAKPEWGTIITKIEPNNISISGYRLDEIILNASLLETAHLLVKTELPSDEILLQHNRTAVNAACQPAPDIERIEGEDVSQTLAKCFLSDRALAGFSRSGTDGPVNKTVYALGRFARYLAGILGHENVLDQAGPDTSFTSVIYGALTGERDTDPDRTRLIEAMITASVDHGVTPPSAQATLIAASARSSYEMSVAVGVGAITDVHGGAGSKAAGFFRQCVSKSSAEKIDLETATRLTVEDCMRQGRRIEGLGHRVHTQDPRRDVLWNLSESFGLAGPCVKISKLITGIFHQVRAIHLPINVDGVIGAIVADLGLPEDLAKVLFIFGRVAGLSAHYFEEIASQAPMRSISFAEAVYKGRKDRSFPK